jgi:hypothetical protein
MIELYVPPALRDRAEAMAEAMGALNNSIEEGAGNAAGLVGQRLAADYYHCRMKSTYDHDSMHRELGIEVKTKRTSVAPQPDYDCSVAVTSLHQKCDAYVFARCLKDLSVCWLLGYMPRPEFMEKAAFYRKGDVDPSNGWKAKADCYSVHVERLHGLDELLPDVKHRHQQSRIDQWLRRNT